MEKSLLELAEAMRLAAEAGDFETVSALLERRQAYLEEALARAADDPRVYEALVQVATQDQEILERILKEQERIRDELAKLQARRRMRAAYLKNMAGYE